MKINSLFLKTILLSLIVASCEDPNYPDSVWDENDSGNATPSISSVEPASGAFAGIDTITCLLYTSPSPRDATLSGMPGCA